MEFTIGRQRMICGMSDVEANVFNLYTGKSGKRWLVADVENAGEHIYVEDLNPNIHKTFRGFGGATLEFKLTSGETISLTGPWHSNADALYYDTDVDVRDKFYTFIVIGKGRRFDGNTTIITDVIYVDEKPVLGKFERGEEQAKIVANQLGIEIVLYSETRGGSSCGFVKPDGVKEEDDD